MKRIQKEKKALLELAEHRNATRGETDPVPPVAKHLSGTVDRRALRSNQNRNQVVRRIKRRECTEQGLERSERRMSSNAGGEEGLSQPKLTFLP